jgi:hypothetical protein
MVCSHAVILNGVRNLEGCMNRAVEILRFAQDDIVRRRRLWPFRLSEMGFRR